MNSLKPQDIGSGLCEKCGRPVERTKWYQATITRYEIVADTADVFQNETKDDNFVRLCGTCKAEFIASLKRPEQ